MVSDELLAYLFDGKAHILAASMAEWLASERRFTTFVTTYRDKIRKKLRVTQEPESVHDLRLELETAYLLLRQRSLSLVYEPQERGQTRRPDFAVTFTTSSTFIMEVTRVRAAQQEVLAQVQQPGPAPRNAAPSLSHAERIADTMCSKLGQLLPQRSNVLLIGVEGPFLTIDDLRAVMLRLQHRVERNDATVLQRHLFHDRAAFFHQYQRLSEVLVRPIGRSADEPVVGWVNPQAKHPLPPKIRTVLYRSQTG